MNKPLPPTPFQVLIVAKTRMQKGFCVGGITQNGRSVRLGVPAKLAVERFNDEYKIGDVWLIEKHTLPKNLTPPHIEDIDVLSKKWQKRLERDGLLAAIEQRMPPVVGGLDCLFDGAVHSADSRRLYIDHQNVPQCSTLFWRPDRPLRLTATPAGKFRYVYGADSGDCFF